MDEAQPTVPYGYCRCGCGRKTNLAPYSAADRDQVKGEPMRFLKGHYIGKRTPRPPGPAPLCACGCGEPTTLRYGRYAKFSKSGHARRKPVSYTVEDRGFRTLCWIWNGAMRESGYGRIDREGPRPAHRFMYEQRYGPVSAELFMDHLCRVTSCVNPDHLEPVMPAENSRRGALAKLTWSSVLSVRLMKETTSLTQAAIADVVGVSPSTVCEILKGQIWQLEKSWPQRKEVIG